ncbi:unnamed protein product [Moneuplotes crassus]|uniref:Uncharacterized protein n=1 Tax=Euplotes crassus TaxID=5936 RepID=A0AAD1XU26_EUPCR|nr:unnamed protein product [Moneuplotes crassus]
MSRSIEEHSELSKSQDLDTKVDALIHRKKQEEENGVVIQGGEIISSHDVMEEKNDVVQFTNVENAKIERSSKQDTRDKIIHTDSCNQMNKYEIDDNVSDKDITKARYDRYGTVIQRSKDRSPHKVSFKDQVGEGKVATVIRVESYKKYNKDGERKGSTVTCACHIF